MTRGPGDFLPREPSEAENARWEEIDDTAADAIEVNAVIASVLQDAIKRIGKLELAGTPSMIRGFDLTDVLPALRELVPACEDRSMIAMVQEWAIEQFSGRTY